MSACSSSERQLSEDNAGTLEVALTTTDSQGEVYRLRNARFYIEGYPDYAYPSSSAGAGGSEDSYYYSETVATESEPNTEVLSRRVVPGSYYVSFDTSQAWYIEHVTAHGNERVSQSVLLSNTTQYLRVYNRSTSSAFYQFGVDGRVIDFRHGDLVIRIGVEHPNGAGGSAGEPGGGIGGLEASGGDSF